jgi:hypothetical protein
MQYFITSAPAIGFNSCWRAGRPWPKNGKLVELRKDLDDDLPAKEQPEKGPLIIGKKTWEALKGDPRIFARPAGDIEDIAQASAALADARTRIKGLEEEIAVLTAENAKLKGEVPAAALAPAAPVEAPVAHAKGKGGK